MSRTAVVVSVVVTASFVLCAAEAAGRVQERPDSVVGVIVGIDSNARRATIKTDAGALVAIKADDNTACLRIPAGEKTLAKAVAIQFVDIAVGDRVLGHGIKIGDEFRAQRLVVMPKAEVEKKRAHDLEEWRQRGIGGIVRELNTQTGEITLELRSAGAGGRVSIATGKADFRRYAPGSLRFEDANPSTFADLKVGDQLRALGAKSADGRSFAAEEIVSGAFKTIGVTVTEVDLQKKEIKAATLDQKKPITISINGDSVLHRISPPVAAAIAQRAAISKPAAAAPGSPPLTGQKPAGQPVIDVQQMIDTLPGISLAELKPGDVLAVTGAVEADESRLVAIKLAAGVDLVLKAMAPQPGKPQVVRLSAGLPSVFDFSVIPIN
jgi:hypothetical protein